MGAQSFYSVGDQSLFFAVKNDTDLSIEEQIQELRQIIKDAQALLDDANEKIAIISKQRPAANTEEYALSDWESFANETQVVLDLHQKELCSLLYLLEKEHQEPSAHSELGVPS